MLNIYKKIRDTSFYTFHHILYIYDWVIFGEIPVMILWVGDIIQIQKLTNVLSKKKKKKKLTNLQVMSSGTPILWGWKMFHHKLLIYF